MKLDFFDSFKDPYMKTEEGRGVFLSGVALGMLARAQVDSGGSIDSSPMFKQLNFGKMQRRDIRRHLSRMPELVRVCKVTTTYAGMIEAICAEAGKLLLCAEEKELGTDGNFAFSMAFLNAPDYFRGKIFKKNEEE